MKKNVRRALLWGCIIGLLVAISWSTVSTFAFSNTQSNFVTVKGTGFMVQGHPYTINGVNYYPRDTPWDRFWPNYNGKLTDQDFSLLNKLHINAARIFVPFYDFHKGPTSKNASTRPASSSPDAVKLLNQLEDLLQRARNHNLHIIITLFDFHTDYGMPHRGQADQYLQTILTHFQADSTILAWDLKNEPDLDYPAMGKAQVDSWLIHIACLAHIYAPHHLLTIGWSNATAARTRISDISFVSFHYYLPVSELSRTYSVLHSTIPDLPIVLTEFGFTTISRTIAGNKQAEAEQAQYYAGILDFWHTIHSPGTFCWTLYDFTYVPNLFGNDPQQIEAQKHFGLLRINNTLKPAASQVSSHFSLQQT